MDRAICPHIKRDGCYRHWSLHEKNIEKIPCGVCKKPTISITGYCPKHSSRFHSLNYRMRQKGVITQDSE
ncbi:hypothetical protein Glove_78g90 [Diversispora epigaea]|uniref:Uncharacterized protein n=1 Tax=Diversispora epigaea TaxID=1348612 RepID=A0A397J8M6_9GLOM|nr:hypothetical protein Glove_78g90 [Diversispora epigaea]